MNLDEIEPKFAKLIDKYNENDIQDHSNSYNDKQIGAVEKIIRKNSSYLNHEVS